MTFNLDFEYCPLAAEQKLLKETNFHWRQVDSTSTKYLDVILQGTFEFKKSKITLLTI